MSVGKRCLRSLDCEAGVAGDRRLSAVLLVERPVDEEIRALT